MLLFIMLGPLASKKYQLELKKLSKFDSPILENPSKNNKTEGVLNDNVIKARFGHAILGGGSWILGTRNFTPTNLSTEVSY